MHTGKSLLRIPYNPRKKKLSEQSPPISRQLSYGIRQRNVQSKTQCGQVDGDSSFRKEV